MYTFNNDNNNNNDDNDDNDDNDNNDNDADNHNKNFMINNNILHSYGLY